MGKNYIESSLKRFLKRKIKITLGLVVTFLITGAVAFSADSTADIGSTQWHKEQAEKWIEGYGKNDFPVVSEEKLVITQDGKITFEGKEIDLSSLKGNLSNKEKNVLTAMGNIVNGKDNTIDMSDVEGYNEGLDAEIVNKGISENIQNIPADKIGYNYGIINTSEKDVQKIGKNAVGYNYGIINTANRNAQNIDENGKAYNYGIINAEKGYAQSTWKSEAFLYNYGILTSPVEYVQTVEASNSKVYNYGVLKSIKGYVQYVKGQSDIYNFGVIKSEGAKGQVVRDNGTAYNYGLINVASDGQTIVATGGNLYNFGIISTSKGVGISHSGTGEAVNHGVIDFRNNSTTDIFSGNVENNGLIISSASDLSKLKLGTGKNNGVILDSSFNFDKQYNSNVTDLTTSGTIDGTENKTYYAKDKTVEFKNDLAGNVFTTVVTKEGTTAFKYTGDDKLTLKDSTVMGYFLTSGTLLDIQGGKELELVNSKVNTVVGVGSDVADVTAINLNGGKLTFAGESETTGKVAGRGEVGYVSVHSNNQSITLESGDITLTNDNGTYNLDEANTDVIFNNIKADNLSLEFTVDTNKDVNKIVLNNAELKSIDGSSSTEKIDLTIEDTEKVGNITLGQNDDVLTTVNGVHKGIIDMGANEKEGDTFNVSLGTVEAEHHKEAGNTFDYKVNGTEKIVLNGEGWHIGENAELNAENTAKAGEKTTLHIADSSSLHVEMNNNFGKGDVTTSLDKMAEGADLSVTTGKDAEVRFVVGDKFDVSDKQFDIAYDYSVKDANLGVAVIFKGTGENGKVQEDETGKITLTVKEVDEYNGKLDNYKGIYDAMLGALSENEELRNAVNYSDESKLVGMISEVNNTAEAFYTTGYAVTKDVTDTYMSVAEDFGRKAGKGEWIAYGKYVNSDTEFDGGKASKGYDGDITGTVGMIEYGVNDTTSYGAVFGKGDTEVDIQGGGKLDGDNTYAGIYMKHRTQTGIDLTANVGYTKSDLDLDLATSASIYNMITSGSSDSDALTFALKGTKDYKVSDSVRLQPVVSARYSLINQDAVESRDANFRIDEQDVTIFEGAFGGNIIKDFNIADGTLSLMAGAEFVLTEVSKSDDGRYTLYEKEITLLDEEDIADSRIEGHIGAEYIHENGIGIDAKYEMIWTDKGDTDRITAGVSYKF